MGLTPYLPEERQGPVIVNVHVPNDPAWNLQAFVDSLKARNVLISNFHNTPVPTFRVGCIGAITPADMADAVRAMHDALDEIGVTRRKAA
jgi:2-aminoethylphosphonate-pyruvate transaminase